MIKKLLIFVSMLVMFLLVVSCVPKELTDEELEAELAKLTPEERVELLADLEAKEGGALAGQASRDRELLTAKYAGKTPVLAKYVIRASSSQITRVKTVITQGVTTVPPVGQAGPTTCSDDDAPDDPANPYDVADPKGKDYYEKGTITGTGVPAGGRDDACAIEGGDDLRENFCSSIPNGLHQEVTVKCSQWGPKNFPGQTGWRCFDGACTDKLPDLVVSSAEFKEFTNASGKFANITAIVKNVGLISTGVGFNTLFKPTWVSSTSLFSSALAAGAEFALSDAVVFPCPQSVSVDITGDWNKLVAESDEAKNRWQLMVTCT